MTRTTGESALLKMTPPQHQLLKQLLQAWPHGLDLDRLHTQTVDGLMRRRLVTVTGDRVVLTAPTKLVRLGFGGTRRVLDLPDDELDGGDVA
jgi:hypothetical protein